jgi:hypothetical protein
MLQGEKLPARGGGMLRVSLAPAPMTAAQAAQTARRLLTTVRVQYQPSGQVARKLAIDPRTLGKITGAASLAAHSHSHTCAINPMLTLSRALADEATQEAAACCVGKEHVQAGRALTSLGLFCSESTAVSMTALGCCARSPIRMQIGPGLDECCRCLHQFTHSAHPAATMSSANNLSPAYASKHGNVRPTR